MVAEVFGHVIIWGEDSVKVAEIAAVHLRAMYLGKMPRLSSCL